MALLVLAAAAGLRVTAVHVDHGLRPGSAAEADVVAAVSRRYGAEFRSVRVEVRDGPNLEARARAARRAALPDDAMTGHTADDQAETVLLNLMRGAGLDGLGGIRSGPSKPILELRRVETRNLCASEGLEPVRDPSNQSPLFRRNRVRQELLPLLCAIAERDAGPVIARQAALLREDADLLDHLSADLDPRDVQALRAAPAPLARRALRRWLAAEAGGDEHHPPGAATVERVLSVVRGEAAACELPGGRRLARSGGRLCLSCE